MSAADNAGLIYVVGISQLIVQLGSLGWPNLIRRVASNFDRMPTPLAAGFLLRSAQLPTASVVVASTALMVLSWIEIFGEPTSTNLRYAALVALPIAVNAFLREYLAGFNRPTISTILSETVPLSLSLLMIWAFSAYSAKSAATCLASAYVVATVIQWFVISPRLVPLLAEHIKLYETARWARTAGFTVLGFGSKLLMDRTDAIFLAPIAGIDQLAYFNSAVRLASLSLIVPVILIPVFSPRVSAAFHMKDLHQLRLEVFLQLAAVGLVLAPAALVLLLSPSRLLGALFGAAYSGVGDVLWLILFAQSLFALSLPFSNLLLMTDSEIAYASISFVALIATFSIAALAIPAGGIHGAALAMLAGNSVLFLGLTFSSGRRLRAIAN